MTHIRMVGLVDARKAPANLSSSELKSSSAGTGVGPCAFAMPRSALLQTPRSQQLWDRNNFHREVTMGIYRGETHLLYLCCLSSRYCGIGCWASSSAPATAASTSLATSSDISLSVLELQDTRASLVIPVAGIVYERRQSKPFFILRRVTAPGPHRFWAPPRPVGFEPIVQRSSHTEALDR